MNKTLLHGALLFVLGSVACSGAYDSAVEGDGRPGGIGDDVTDTTLPPETEVVTRAFLGVAPGVTEEYLYVANPSIDSISRISVARPHEISLIRTGLEPGIIRTTPQHVLVLNRGDHTVSLLDAASGDLRNVRIPADVNDIVFHPSGFGVGYVDKAALDGDAVDGGARSLDVVSIIDIAAGRVVSRALGFAPRAIVLATGNDGTPLALAATDARGTLLNLATATASPIPFTTSTFGTLEEALLTNDGGWAFFREADRNGVRAVRLADGIASSVAGDSVATDMDLSADADVLYVSDRNPSRYRLRRFAVGATEVTFSAAVTSPHPYAQTEFTPDGSRGILFTAAANLSAVAIFDPGDDSITDVPLVAPVAAAIPAPDSRSALIVHRAGSSALGGPVVSMLDLATGDAPAIELAGDIHGIAFSPDGDFAFLTTEKPDYLVTLSLRNGLHAAHALDAKPLFLSAMPLAGGHAFVTQEHDAGRILFLDVTASAASVETDREVLTGYLLGTEAE